MSSFESSRERVEVAMTRERLENFLRANNVPLEEWGKGFAKTIDHLFTEIQSGESSLKVADGQVIREVKSLVMNIYSQIGDEIWRLVEDRQVFEDGRTRVRNDWVSLGEKMTHGEDVQLALRRALAEELGISGVRVSTERPSIEEEKPSESYPGILSKHVRHLYDVIIRAEDFKPEGYIEVQPDKTTYFVWKRVDAMPEGLGDFTS